ncbi:MAG: hypothetical protein IMF15_07705 [Proteobacteria bacterium]|nr:hypothetical protein [Pseudomonadota bacterium]
MKSPLYKLDKISSLVPRLALTTILMVLAPASFAEVPDLAYVDSVHKWGAWGLDIEPAAGGLSQPTTQALNARNSKVALRTNSISALAPPASSKSPVIFESPSTPIVPPVVPVTPPSPPVTPPIGGPTDGLF